MSRLLTPPGSIFRTLQGDVLRTQANHSVFELGSHLLGAPLGPQRSLRLAILMTGAKFSSTCPALGRFGSESPTRMSPFFLMSCRSIFTNLQGDVLRTQAIPPCLRFWRDCPRPTGWLPSSIPRTPIRLINQPGCIYIMFQGHELPDLNENHI